MIIVSRRQIFVIISRKKQKIMGKITINQIDPMNYRFLSAGYANCSSVFGIIIKKNVKKIIFYSAYSKDKQFADAKKPKLYFYDTGMPAVWPGVAASAVI